MILPHGIRIAKTIIRCRLGYLRANFPTWKSLARSLRQTPGKYTILFSEDLTYLSNFGLWSAIPTMDSMIRLLGVRFIKRLKKAELQLELVYDRDDKKLSGLFIKLIKD